MLLTAACTPDPDTAAPTTTTAPDPVTTEATTTSVVTPTGISDDCSPLAEAPEIPASWPSDRPLVVVTGGSLSIDLADIIEADCFVLATSYSAGLDIPTPELGHAVPATGASIEYSPASPPPDPDHPSEAWWGEDRIRACVQLDDERRGCTNIDIHVLRADVATLRHQFAVTTLPQLTTPLTRSGMRDGGVTTGGIARLQDAYAAQWALGLVAQTLELPEPPLELRAACEATGNDIDALIGRGRQLSARFTTVVDLSTVELTTTMGNEPDPELAATANEAIAAVTAWRNCEL